MSQEQREASEQLKRAKARQLEQTSEEDLLATIIGDQPYIPGEEIEAEIPVRQIRVSRELAEALDAFRAESATASGRLKGLTRWLIGFTIGLVAITFWVVLLTAIVVVLNGVVIWHDFTR